MPKLLKTLIPIVTVVAGFISLPVVADEPSNAVARKMLMSEILPHIPDHMLTAVTVEINPGTSVPAHKHEAFVYVYVLEGKVRSQLDNEEVVEYQAGESWVEPPGVTHSLTENPSETDKAKILAVFIAKQGAKLTTSGEISH